MKLAYHNLYGDKQYSYIVRPAQDRTQWKAMKKKKAIYGDKGKRTWKGIKGMDWMDTQEEAEKALADYAKEKIGKNLLIEE